MLGSLDFSMVPKAGLEPARSCLRQILSLLRLPFRHSGAPLTLESISSRPPIVKLFLAQDVRMTAAAGLILPLDLYREQIGFQMFHVKHFLSGGGRRPPPVPRPREGDPRGSPEGPASPVFRGESSEQLFGQFIPRLSLLTTLALAHFCGLSYCNANTIQTM